MIGESLEEIEESFDSETGEKKTKFVPGNVRQLKTDAETGEPDSIDIVVKRKTFQIPLEFLNQPLESFGRRMKSRRKISTEWYLKKSDRFQSGVVKAISLSQKQRMSPLVFVLPTLLIFPTWASILCLLWEICMHIWSHRKNKRRKNFQFEYRSPLHLLSSHFCVHCRTRKWTEKVKEIQKKRSLKRQMKKQKHGRRNLL